MSDQKEKEDRVSVLEAENEKLREQLEESRKLVMNTFATATEQMEALRARGGMNPAQKRIATLDPEDGRIIRVVEPYPPQVAFFYIEVFDKKVDGPLLDIRCYVDTKVLPGGFDLEQIRGLQVLDKWRYLYREWLKNRDETLEAEIGALEETMNPMETEMVEILRERYRMQYLNKKGGLL